MIQSVEITTGARLHFGFLANRRACGIDLVPSPESDVQLTDTVVPYCDVIRNVSQQGRNFGGVGLMIAEPRFRVVLERADADEFICPSAWKARVERLIRAYRTNCEPEVRPPPCRIQIAETIPAHAGLGSGTQLAMAVAKGLALLANDRSASDVCLAQRVERGRRSALGIHGFIHGGLLVDGGKQNADRIGTLSDRVSCPQDWRVVLVCARTYSAVSGLTERETFEKLPEMPQATTDRLCRILMSDLLPAVRIGDCDAFGESLFEFNRIVGEYFAPVQGVVYASDTAAALVAFVRSQGIHGVGQSSWGPTLFSICQDQQTAKRLIRILESDSRWQDHEFRCVTPLQTGAHVRTME